VGLGNPGKKYEKTRHNVGFMTVEGLKLKVESFSDWRNIGKLQAKISEGEISSQRVILVKPQTFMNESGKSVKSLTKQYALTANNLIVIHDDLDLPLGKIRISVGIGSAGHKGVESIIRESKTKDFVRFRIGIKPTNEIEAEKFVLQKFKKEEGEILKEVIEKMIEAIEMAIKEGLEKAMNEYNK
jgi:PTH1 family peptidyl-tRNA hydrolase